jgi:hypothetical protein
MIRRVLTAAADERNQSNPKQASIVPPRLELVLTATSIDIEISPILRADNFGAPDGQAQRTDDGVRPRQRSPERARVKAPADLRNCTRKTQGTSFG